MNMKKPKWHIGGAHLLSIDGVGLGMVDFDTSTIISSEHYDAHDVHHWVFRSPGYDGKENMQYPTQEQYEVYNLWVYSLVQHKMGSYA